MNGICTMSMGRNGSSLAWMTNTLFLCERNGSSLAWMTLFLCEELLLLDDYYFMSMGRNGCSLAWMTNVYVKKFV